MITKTGSAASPTATVHSSSRAKPITGSPPGGVAPAGRRGATVGLEVRGLSAQISGTVADANASPWADDYARRQADPIAATCLEPSLTASGANPSES